LFLAPKAVTSLQIWTALDDVTHGKNASKFRSNWDPYILTLPRQNIKITKFIYGLQVRASCFQLNQTTNAATSRVYYLFKYSSTCFGHPHVQHQELQLQ